MAFPLRKIGHSLLESLLFLAVLGAASAFFGFFPGIKETFDIPPYVYVPVFTAAASGVVALAFPKPTFLQAFLKLFIGGIFTFLIFVVLVAVLGTAVFDSILALFWNNGAAVWSWSSGGSIVAAVFAIIMYIFFALFIVGLIFAGLFALTHILVLMVMNLFIKRNEGDEEEETVEAIESAQKRKPFT